MNTKRKTSVRQLIVRPCVPGRRYASRSGAVLVWFAMLILSLLAVTGLVIDVGFLTAGHRHAQNAADAAAMAAAMDLLRGHTPSDAEATAIAFVNDHNDLADAPPPVVNIPPVSGPYAGASNYVEVIVTSPIQTFLIQILPGVADTNDVSARAVAGVEFVAGGEGVIALDHGARPGVDVTGGAQVKVLGWIIDNSQGGGLDENGEPAWTETELGENQYAGKVTGNASVQATRISVVGGVNDPEAFQDVDTSRDANVLYCNQTPVPDPLIYLPTPNTGNGVLDIFRGEPHVSDGSPELGDQHADPVEEGQPANYVDMTDPENPVVMLYPGIYESITVTGGNVVFAPGIYVIRPARNTENSLKLTGGEVTANGIMFYLTGDDYQVDGTPDSFDADPDAEPAEYPPDAGNANFGRVTINASLTLRGIDTEQYEYDLPDAVDQSEFEKFNGMLFYQRRANQEIISLEGNASEGSLEGTLYAKWAEFKIAGQGVYNAQFIAGSFDFSGQGEVIIDYTGSNLAKAPRVFLVE